uniref:Uncharacterized protein n=1 Tax=Caenorhabditis tropicalis TaxID=1561998 RepID=A0A1I7V548_9PELO
MPPYKCLSILTLFIAIHTSNSSNLIEDITDKEEASDDDHLQTFPTPPPIGTTTSTGDALFNRMNEILRKEDREKSQNFQIFNEKVCDLFAHVGDQAPARLLKFQTRDYFEPTDVVHCLSVINGARNSESEEIENSPPSPPPPPSSPIIALATNTDKRDEEEEDTTQKVEDITVQSTETESNDSCPRGKQSTFLRTEEFELFKHDEQEMVVEDVAECAKACIKNTVV